MKRSMLLAATILAGPTGPALAIGNTLTMTGSAYDTATPRFGTASLNGGYGQWTNTASSGNTFTWEAWVKLNAAPGAPVVAIGSGSAGYLGANAAGQAVCNVANGNTTITGPAIADGKWHLLDLVGSASGIACYVDGASAGTSTNVESVPASAAMGVGTMGGYAGANVWAGGAWTGEIDEASVWNTAHVTGAFTPPSGPYTGTETGLVALWHFNGTGVDGAADLVIPPTSAAILYSPFNWSAEPFTASTINAGATFRTLFTGSTCALNFDTSDAAAPASEIYWRVDGYEAGTPWTRATPAANIACTPSGDLAAAPWHLLEVAVKSTSETINRWNNASAGTVVRLAGLTLAPGSAVQAPAAAPWTVVVFGDSIAEGVRSVNQTATNDTDRNDATLGWAYGLGREMGAEIGVVGFGAQGLATAGSGGVPPLSQSWNLLANGVARPVATGPVPNLIVIESGTDDGGTVVTSAALSVLNGLIAAYPNTPIAVLVPFNGSHAAELQAAALQCSRPGQVHLVPTAGLLNPADGIDTLGLHPLGPNDEGFVAPRLAAMLMPILVGGASGLSPTALAGIP